MLLGAFEVPRKFLFTKDEIIKVALDLTREKGINGVTARALGAKLGTSSQPVFGYFENMAQVKQSVIKSANELNELYIKQEIEKGKYPPYKASGMAYIRFAREEKELFKLLYMRDRSNEEELQTSEQSEKLLELVLKQVKITKERAKMFYLEMWTYVHGIATMIATNYYDLSEDLASKMLTDMYQGLKNKYESENS